MFGTLILMTLLVGWFAGIATCGGAFAMIVRKNEKKKSAALAAMFDDQPYDQETDPIVPDSGPILTYS